jgi:hypothetical protein
VPGHAAAAAAAAAQELVSVGVRQNTGGKFPGKPPASCEEHASKRSAHALMTPAEDSAPLLQAMQLGAHRKTLCVGPGGYYRNTNTMHVRRHMVVRTSAPRRCCVTASTACREDSPADTRAAMSWMA